MIMSLWELKGQICSFLDIWNQCQLGRSQRRVAFISLIVSLVKFYFLKLSSSKCVFTCLLSLPAVTDAH